jgi:putative RNA 2'-phosphotransferase
MAHALRHQPWLYELELDEEGWTPVADLLAGLNSGRRHHITEADLQAVLDRPGKKRYEMADGRIRALYGHSTTAKIRKQPAAPPEILYHGTAPAAAEIILREGLKPMSRQYVHLSLDQETAVQVGRRKSPQPVILTILAAAAHQQGISFYEGHGLVWLADFVPPEFIRSA